MRIAFVIPYFYPALGYGGTPRFAYDISRALARRGHQVTVLTTDSGGAHRIPGNVSERIQRNELDGIQVRFYKNVSNSLAYRHRLFVPPGFFLDVRRRLSKNQIVHIHDLRSFLSVACYSAVRSLRIPYALSPHGGLQHLGKKHAKLIFDRLWGHAILKHAAALCAVSPSEEHEAATFGVEAQRIYRFPPPIDADAYTDLPPGGGFASHWGLKGTRFILFLGRLHWIKGVDVLIQAFSLIQEPPDAHLVIAGLDDGAEEQLRSLVKDKGLEKKVTFTGFLNDKQKLMALVDSDVVVVPSRHEAFSLTVLEAMAAETPVILTSACELGNWMNGQRGLISFRSGDSEDLAQKLTSVLTRGPELEILRAGRIFVMNEFSLESLAARTEQLYEFLI